MISINSDVKLSVERPSFLFFCKMHVLCQFSNTKKNFDFC